MDGVSDLSPPHTKGRARPDIIIYLKNTKDTIQRSLDSKQYMGGFWGFLSVYLVSAFFQCIRASEYSPDSRLCWSSLFLFFLLVLVYLLSECPGGE